MKQTLFLISFLLIFSCSKEEVELLHVDEIVNVSLGINNFKTKAGYDQNAQGTFDPYWDIDDKLILRATNTKFHDNSFYVTKGGTSGKIEGKIQTWRGKKNLYAFYPYNTLSPFANQFNYVSSSSINVGEKDPMDNMVLVAVHKNAEFKNGELNVKHLRFKQAMSFLKFELEDLKDLKLIGITLRDDYNRLYPDCNIIIDTNCEFKYDYQNGSIATNSIYKNVNDYSKGTNLFINFEVIPTTMVRPEIVLHVQDSEGNIHKYLKPLIENLEFKRNVFNYFGEPLNIHADFTKI